MSMIQDPRPTTTVEPEADPFRYGWRYVKVTRPDGTMDFDQVPLTLEDTLYPQEEDFIVTSYGHHSDCHYLSSVLGARLVGDPSAVVLSDCRVAFVPELRPVGPDVAVFLGVRQVRDWGTFDAVQEGARPVLVIEVTSPETRSNDVGIKVAYYHQAGVPLYVIVDAREVGGQRRLPGTTPRWRRHTSSRPTSHRPDRWRTDRVSSGVTVAPSPGGMTVST